MQRQFETSEQKAEPERSLGFELQSLERLDGAAALNFIGDVNSRGKGIGTQARLELQELVARELGIVEIVSRIRVDNVGSLRSAAKAGLVERKRDAEWVILGKNLETHSGNGRGGGV